MDMALLAKLKKSDKLIPRRPDGFGITVREWMSENKGFTEGMARNFLNSLVEAGELECKNMIHEGRGGNVMVYYEPGSWKGG